jgi:hypothetical protein
MSNGVDDCTGYAFFNLAAWETLCWLKVFPSLSSSDFVLLVERVRVENHLSRIASNPNLETT